MKKISKIYVAGHRGLVGAALMKKLQNEGFNNIICRTHDELDLTRQEAVEAFFKKEKPEYVFLAAAKVGGIWGNNSFPAEFIYSNLTIQNNIIHASYINNVKKLLFLGSSCIYPKHCPQPMKEEYLLSGHLEPTNEPYAIAKIAGIKMCQSYNRQYGTNYISVMPTNLYGPNDNFDMETSHVLPALIRKFHLAKLAAQGHRDDIQKDEKIFGPVPDEIKESLGINPSTNKPLSQSTIQPKVVLWGTGKDLTIKELAETVDRVTGFDGDIQFDTSKPDGTQVKRLYVSRLNDLGWQSKIELEKGIKETYDWYISSIP